jgi:(p)ppGpp synthase/HD superfamily hydrolase
MEFCHTAKAQSRLRSILRKDRKTLAERGEKLYHDFIAKEGMKPSKEMMQKIVALFPLTQGIQLMKAAFLLHHARQRRNQHLRQEAQGTRQEPQLTDV